MNQLFLAHHNSPNQISFKRETFEDFMAGNLAKMLTMTLVMTVLAMFVLEAQPVDSAFAIPVNPCTLSECIAQCKKILGQKFMSASCVKDGSKGSLCICLG